jgi:hypothetical protein
MISKLWFRQSEQSRCEKHSLIVWMRDQEHNPFACQDGEGLGDQRGKNPQKDGDNRD